ALLTFLICMTFSVFRGGLQGGMLEEHNLTRPNQGTKHSAINSVRTGLVFGISIGVIAILMAPLVGGLVKGWHLLIFNKMFGYPLSAPLIGLALGGTTGLAAALYDRLGGDFFSSSISPEFNFLHVEILFGIFLGFLTTMVVVMFTAIVNVFGNGLSSWLLIGLIVAPGCAAFLGAIHGGFACIKHFSLRGMLWLVGYGPWNYPRFLDYAADRILLRKVGGGYIFIHRLLLDYFASLNI
ncbi:MAG TPA: hypothetical protein VEP90_16825, partial [Methylomirabilota bacterium]|nr:hypothetical protein [Methylomirabilota bacterium]